MIRKTIFSFLTLTTITTLTAMSEFDTLAEIIVGGFYSGNPVSTQFISDWAHSTPEKLAQRINEECSLPDSEEQQHEMLSAMLVLLGTRIEAPTAKIKFRDTMNSLSFEDEKRAIPLIFNYMYR
jgi:hypothetical protein